MNAAQNAPHNASTQGSQSQRKTPVLASLSASQIAAIRSIPSHEQAVVHTAEARRPVHIFTDPAYFALERASLFNKTPVPVTLSSMLPEPKTFLAIDAYDLPILLSRDADGQVKAFLNACQHKGAKVVERTDAFKGARVSCPYHAWTYGLGGELTGVPRQEVFPSLRKEEHGLARLACLEAGGLIWVMLDRTAEPDFSGITAELVGDLEALDLPHAHVFGHKSFDLEANWKLVLEPFLEPYHIQRLHAATVAGMFADVASVTTQLGKHIRQSSGKANFEPAMLDLPDENIHKTITHAYMVFPNTVIITSPYYISIMIVIPRAADRSTVVYFMLTREPADNDKALDLYTRSYEMVLNVFGNEDFRAACISQKGLASGALKEVVYGGLETNIPMFYDIVERFIAGDAA